MPRFFVPSLVILASMGSPLIALAAAPTIGNITYPSTVNATIATTLSVSVSSAVGVSSCNLYVDSEDQGPMTVNGSTATKSFTFPRGGVFTLFAFCKDNNNGMASGPNTSILVQGQIVQTPSFGGGSSAPVVTPPVVTPTPAPSATTTPPTAPSVAGKRVKLICQEGALSDDPCKAVYFVGRDGKRRAFPNEKAYFTWYQNFDEITELTADELRAFPLGQNVTYRPGLRMVKFETLNRVYLVTRGGVLRWVMTEDVARGLYGDDWNTKIDDVQDAFYTNYTFGADVSASEQVNLGATTAESTSIDDGS